MSGHVFDLPLGVLALLLHILEALAFFAFAANPKKTSTLCVKNSNFPASYL
jgi:hypothetical protein